MVRFLRHWPRLIEVFRRDASGQIIILFALMSTVLVFAGGAGIDLMRAYQAHQVLSNVAALACQYASRPAILQLSVPDPTGAARQPGYADAVNAYIASALLTQKFSWTQTNAPAFTFVQNGRADVKLASSVPTSLTKVLHVDQMPVAASMHCYDSPPTKPPSPDDPCVICDSFEDVPTPTTDHGSWVVYAIPGKGVTTTPSADAGPTPAYTTSSGVKWFVTGYCLETDQVGTVSATVADGQRSAELDCDNGAYSAGNSAISAKKYLEVGNYELRYNYLSRVLYPNYYPAYLCGSDDRDLTWANDRTVAPGPVGNAARTNQINVYLDRDTTGSAPLHTTRDGAQRLAGVNLIDMCVYAADWTERSLRISVRTPGNYWLSFAADGQNDGAGGELDRIQLCKNTCKGELKNNFPKLWTPDGTGTPKLLFEDTFESPAYTEDPAPYSYHGIAKGAPLNDGSGASGTATAGWPYQVNTGWMAAPINQATRGTKHAGVSRAFEGGQYLLLDGWNADGSANTNRLISRPFLLVPGYYQVAYAYMSVVDFSMSGATQAYCYAAPNSGPLFPVTGNSPGVVLDMPGTRSFSGSTEIVGAFLSNGQLVSTPIGGGAQGSVTSFTNPDGSVSMTAAAPPDRVNWLWYDAAVSNPVLDVCGYAPGYAWQKRSVAVKVAKTGLYWLTFSANGSVADGNGGAVDDVRLSALGSPYMANPPVGAVAIPVPAPAPDVAYAPNNTVDFTIVADPFVPPAPLQ